MPRGSPCDPEGFDDEDNGRLSEEADLDGVAIAGEADVDKSLVRLQILQGAHYVGMEPWIESVYFPNRPETLLQIYKKKRSFFWVPKLSLELWLHESDTPQRYFDRKLSC